MQLGLNRLLEHVKPPHAADQTNSTPAAGAPPVPSRAGAGPLHSLPLETDRELWRCPPLDYAPSPAIADSVLASFEPLPYLPGGRAAAAMAAPVVAAKPVSSAEHVTVAAPERAPAIPETPRSPAAESLKPADAPVEFDFAFQGPFAATPGWRRHLLKLAIAAAVACVVSYFAIRPGPRTESPRAAAQAIAPAGPEWIADWSRSDPGDYIALFEPSWDWSDYLVESSAVPGEGVAWVYRASDPDNYYALRLEDRAAGKVRLVRYAVIHGQQTDPIETALAELPPGESYAVRLEVRGARFSLFLGDRLSAEWTDTQLGRGGFGVIGRRTDLAHTGEVKVTRLAQDSAYRSLPPTSRSLTPTLAAITITRMEGKESN